MKIKELMNALSDLDPNGNVCVVDYDQNTSYGIAEVRYCDDHSSEWYKNYADIAIDIHRPFDKPDFEEVAEWCPHCENEAYLLWNVDRDGYKAYCPHCGSRLMLCSLCLYNRETGECDGDCDYDEQTNSCKQCVPKKEE